MFGMVWLLWIASLVLFHYSIGDLIPVMADLSQNLKDGFYIVLGFDSMEAESASIQGACVTALTKCGRTVNDCSSISCDGANCQVTANTTAELREINASFARSLSKVSKIANDKYFGTEAFDEAGSALNAITAETEKLDTTGMATVQAAAYCTMHKNSDLLSNGTAEAKKQIDSFMNNKFVNQFNDNIGYLQALHALPYIFGVSMLFYLIFWMKDAACPLCCDGSLGGCCALLFHMLFWLISFVPAAILLVIGYILKDAGNKVKLEGVGLKGDPTLDEIMSHVREEYPKFYGKVFEPLESPLLLMYSALQLYVAANIAIILYGIFVVALRPYTDAKYEPQERNDV